MVQESTMLQGAGIPNFSYYIGEILCRGAQNLSQIVWEWISNQHNSMFNPIGNTVHKQQVMKALKCNNRCRKWRFRGLQRKDVEGSSIYVVACIITSSIILAIRHVFSTSLSVYLDVLLSKVFHITFCQFAQKNSNSAYFYQFTMQTTR